jgi:hypothetical protein
MANYPAEGLIGVKVAGDGRGYLGLNIVLHKIVEFPFTRVVYATSSA